MGRNLQEFYLCRKCGSTGYQNFYRSLRTRCKECYRAAVVRRQRGLPKIITAHIQKQKYAHKHEIESGLFYCRRCKTYLPKENFYRHGTKRSRANSICKACFVSYRIEHDKNKSDGAWFCEICHDTKHVNGVCKKCKAKYEMRIKAATMTKDALLLREYKNIRSFSLDFSVEFKKQLKQLIKTQKGEKHVF